MFGESRGGAGTGRDVPRGAWWAWGADPLRRVSLSGCMGTGRGANVSGDTLDLQRVYPPWCHASDFEPPRLAPVAALMYAVLWTLPGGPWAGQVRFRLGKWWFFPVLINCLSEK